MMRLLLPAVLAAALPFAALAQTADDLKNDEKTPGDVLVYGMGYSGDRYSPLTRITRENVGRLVPVWAYSLSDLQGGEAFPVVKDGVIYITTHNATAAVDALTGAQIWRVQHEYPPETLRVVCCGIVNRGAAIYEGLIIRALMDDRVIALDAKTGKEVWAVHSPEPVVPANGYAMTGAPLIVNGVVIMGVAGAEFSHRGLLEGYDAKTGKHLWRLYTIPAKGEPGSETWEGDFRDHRRRQQFGSPAPTTPSSTSSTGASASVRRGIRAPQGRQPLHQFGVRGASEDRRARVVLSDDAQRSLRLRRGADADPRNDQCRRQPTQGRDAGEPQRLLYVLDAKDGKLIAGNAYGKVNWASGIDLKSGRPQVTEVFTSAIEGKNVTVLAVGLRRHQLAAHVVQPAHRAPLHQHDSRRHDLRGRRAAAAQTGIPSGAGTVKRTVVTDDPNVRGYLKASRSAHRQAEVGGAVPQPQLLIDHGDRERRRLHRGDERRVPGARCGNRQAAVELSDPSGIIGQPVTWSATASSTSRCSAVSAAQRRRGRDTEACHTRLRS